MAGISILFVHNISHSDTHLSQNNPNTPTGTKLKPLSIKTVIDCEIPASHWKESSESSAEQPETIAAGQNSSLPAHDTLAPLFDITTYYEIDDNFQLMDRIFSPPPKTAASKTEAYMEIAEHLNMKFINKGYRRVKGYEQNFTHSVESRVSEMTRFKVKFKADVFRLKITSSIRINDYQRIDISADKGNHSAFYKIEVPIDKLEKFVTSANMSFFSLPLHAISSTEDWLP